MITVAAGADQRTSDATVVPTPASVSSRREAIWSRAGLLFVVAVALASRLTVLDYGLPDSFYSDEDKVVGPVRAIAATGDLRPIHFSYPTFWLYVLAAAAKIGAVIAQGFGEGARFAPAGLDNLAYVYWVTRAVTAVAGALAVVPLYLLSRRLFAAVGTPWPGALALASAGFLALSPLWVQYAPIAAPDVPTSAFLIVAAYFTLRIAEDGQTRWYILAAIATGLASGVKYPSAMFAVAIVAAHLVGDHVAGGHAAARPLLRRLSLGLFDPRLWLAGLVMIGTFVVTSPYVVLDAGRFLEHMGYETDKQFVRGKDGDVFASGPFAPLVYALETLRWGLDTPVGVLAGLGLGWAIWLVVQPVRRREALPLSARLLVALLAYPLAVWIFSWTWQIRPSRYLLPLVPFACVLAGLGLAAVLRGGLGLRSSTARRAAVVAVGGLALGTLLWQADGVVRYQLLLTRPDTRTIAARWMAANLPPGATVVTEWYGPPHPGINQMGADLAGRSIEQYRRRGVRYAATSSFMHDRWTRNPDRYRRRADFYESLDTRATLLFAVEPRPTYPYDSVESGWRGWHGIPLDGEARPGPHIRIYQLAP